MSIGEPLHAQESSEWLPYVIVGGVLAGILGVWTALDGGPSAILVVRYIAVGVVYLALGYILRRQGHGGLGLLLALTGALWFVPEFEANSQGVVVGIGVLLEFAYLATFANAVLAYPRDEVSYGPAVWVVRAAYVVTLVGGAARALTRQPNYWQSCDCPHNSFALWHSRSLFNAVNDPFRVLLMILGIVLIVLTGMKLRSSAQQGGGAPVWALLIGTTLVVVSGIAREVLDLSEDGVIAWLWVEGVGLLLAALSFAALALLKARDPELPQTTGVPGTLAG
jgi:hypothetical protein